jgi:hypothetical protein
MKRILYFKGTPLYKKNVSIEVQYREGYHGKNEPELGELKTGILTIYFIRKTKKKPYHIYPEGVDLISISGCVLDTLSLRDASNEGDGLHFSIEDHYIIVKDLSFVMHGSDNQFKDPDLEYGLGYMQGRGAA